MELKNIGKELTTILIAALILGLACSFLNVTIFFAATISLFIIIFFNVLIKKIYAYNLEADIKPKFWSIYYYGFQKNAHFSKPIPMFWLPLVLSLATRGLFWWLPILEFEVKPKTERVTKRHGLYRFSQMTDWHIALIATMGMFINLILAVLGYIGASWFPSLGLFARLNIYFAAWSILPLSGLDGSKIFFGSRPLWVTMLVIVAIFLGYSLMVF